MTKHYVEISVAGRFFSESRIKEIPSRSTSVELTGYDYSYRVFDREEINVDGELLIGKPKNYGPRHIKGDVYDEIRVQREVSDNEILLSNMRCNGWKRVIKCALGFIPMHDDDIVI